MPPKNKNNSKKVTGCNLSGLEPELIREIFRIAFQAEEQNRRYAARRIQRGFREPSTRQIDVWKRIQKAEQKRIKNIHKKRPLEERKPLPASMRHLPAPLIRQKAYKPSKTPPKRSVAERKRLLKRDNKNSKNNDSNNNSNVNNHGGKNLPGTRFNNIGGGGSGSCMCY